MKKYLIAGVVAMGLSGGVLVSFAASDSESVPQKQPPLVIEQAVALARHYGQGAVVKVELEQKDARDLYEANVQGGNGELRKLYIDANTAEVIQNRQF